MKFSPISNERLSDKVISQIMENIRCGELKPGMRLPNEPELAADFGVSRGILREALTILQTKGIIYRKPKEGTFIVPDVMDVISKSREISVREATYLDLIEVRECFEPRIVEKVIAFASDEEIEELVKLAQYQEKEGSGRSSDYCFHYRLAELSRNVVFANFIDTYYDIIDELKTRSGRQRSRLEEMGREHMEIAEAIRERNVKKAQKCIKYHLKKVKDNILAQEREQ